MNNCQLWPYLKDKDGYGLIKVNGKLKRAHRVAWEAANNTEIPLGQWVLHKCDNPTCVNPEHLYIGDGKQNMLDRRLRGRNKGWKGPNQSGESNSNCKLTINDVEYIRKNRKYGMGKVLAKQFETTPEYIRKIWQGKVW